MKTAYGYLRVSTKGQVKKGGFERQKSAIQKFAEKSNLKIVNFYQDSVSGTSKDRQEYSRMLIDMLSNGVDTIIVENLTRLARDYEVQRHLLRHLVSKQITLISADTEQDITRAIQDDPMQKALVGIQSIFAELEKDLLVVRLKKGRKDAGHSPGRPPLYDKKFKKRIRRLKTKGHSYGHIARKLNKEGRLNTNGNPFSPQLVRMIAIKG